MLDHGIRTLAYFRKDSDTNFNKKEEIKKGYNIIIKKIVIKKIVLIEKNCDN